MRSTLWVHASCTFRGGCLVLYTPSRSKNNLVAETVVLQHLQLSILWLASAGGVTLLDPDVQTSAFQIRHSHSRRLSSHSGAKYNADCNRLPSMCFLASMCLLFPSSHSLAPTSLARFSLLVLDGVETMAYLLLCNLVALHMSRRCSELLKSHSAHCSDALHHATPQISHPTNG